MDIARQKPTREAEHSPAELAACETCTRCTLISEFNFVWRFNSVSAGLGQRKSAAGSW